MKFRRKPIIVDAVQFFPTTAKDTLAFIGSDWWQNPSMNQPAGLYGNVEGDSFTPVGLWINTLEGTLNASPGDWIIKSVKGEFDSCKPAVFTATYESVDDDVAVLAKKD